MRGVLKFAFILIVMLAAIVFAKNETLEHRLRENPDLSEFLELLERDDFSKIILKYKAATIFVPTNEAFRRYQGQKTSVLYHIGNVAFSLDQLETTIYMSTEVEGNPPIYITRKGDNTLEDIFINNAKVLRDKSNIICSNDYGKKQILHVIDEVLVPLTLNHSSSVELLYPNAFGFITNSESLDIGQHRIRSFKQKVSLNKKDQVYQADGFHTYFIPVEEGFKPPSRLELFDHKVIDGHIIPNRLLFTSAVTLLEPFPTLAFEDNIKVTISFFTQSDGLSTKTYVKSNTIIGELKHGVVVAEIVKANIPVKNGVIHLIQRPLMIIDTTVKEFLEENKYGLTNNFYDIIMDFGDEFMQSINRSDEEVTLFVPSNEAWNDSNLKTFLNNKEKMREILNLHFVRERLSTDIIKKSAQHQANNKFQTNADKKFLYFYINTNGDRNLTFTVEGSGFNVTIIQPDIVVTNAYIHIIDRVLGVPYTLE